MQKLKYKEIYDLSNGIIEKNYSIIAKKTNIAIAGAALAACEKHL